MLNHIAEIAERVKKAGNDVAIICRETEVKLQSVSTYRLDFSGASVPFVRGFLFPFASVRLFEQFDLIWGLDDAGGGHGRPGVGDLDATLLESLQSRMIQAVEANALMVDAVLFQDVDD